jgi:stress response protein YsnF
LSEINTWDKHLERVKPNSTTNKSDSNNKSLELQNFSPTDKWVIPIKEERFSISKEVVVENVKIEKRWITKTKKVEVPLLNEEIYVNGRRLKYYDKLLGIDILSKVKARLKEGLDSATNDKKELEYSISEAHESKREIIPIFEGIKNNDGDSDKDDNDNCDREIEKIIPIFGEEIVIAKKRVKVGELVIKKNRVTINNKIKINIKKEEAIVKSPHVIKSDADEI